MNYVFAQVSALWPLWVHLLIVGLVWQPWRRPPRR